MEKTKLKSKKKASEKKVYFLFAIAILISVGIMQAVYFLSQVRDVQVIETKVQVSDKIAFALGTKGMDFGIVMPLGSSTREIGLVNQDETEVRGRIFFKGDMAGFMDASETEFIMAGNETKQISFSVFIPKDAKFGNYTGKVVIIFEKG